MTTTPTPMLTNEALLKYRLTSSVSSVGLWESGDILHNAATMEWRVTVENATVGDPGSDRAFVCAFVTNLEHADTKLCDSHAAWRYWRLLPRIAAWHEAGIIPAGRIFDAPAPGRYVLALSDFKSPDYACRIVSVDKQGYHMFNPGNAEHETACYIKFVEALKCKPATASIMRVKGPRDHEHVADFTDQVVGHWNEFAAYPNAAEADRLRFYGWVCTKFAKARADAVRSEAPATNLAAWLPELDDMVREHADG